MRADKNEKKTDQNLLEVTLIPEDRKCGTGSPTCTALSLSWSEGRLSALATTPRAATINATNTDNLTSMVAPTALLSRLATLQAFIAGARPLNNYNEWVSEQGVGWGRGPGLGVGVGGGCVGGAHVRVNITLYAFVSQPTSPQHHRQLPCKSSGWRSPFCWASHTGKTPPLTLKRLGWVCIYLP